MMDQVASRKSPTCHNLQEPTSLLPAPPLQAKRVLFRAEMCVQRRVFSCMSSCTIA